MKILSLELSGYKRLALRKINYIKITPESKIQLILGTNGSGKSSLLKEMTPLPAVPAEYIKGGFKIIEISHRNNHYILKSLFHSTGTKYHFIKNGIDLLGDGGNGAVYKDHVLQEFGITSDIHEVISGVSRFSDMEIGVRRKWITRLSHEDYTYAIKYYNRIKDQLKGAVEVIKLLQQRSVQESDKLLTPEEENRYREDIRVLSDTLTYFLEMKTPVEKSYQEAMAEIHHLDRDLANYTNEAQRLRAQYVGTGSNSDTIGMLRNLLVSYRADGQTQQALLDIVAKEMDEVDKTMHSLKNSNVQSFEEIDQVIDQTAIDIHQNGQMLVHGDLQFVQPSVSLSALKSIYEHLVEILLNMSSDKERKYSLSYHISLKDKLQVAEGAIEENEKKLLLLQSRSRELVHLKEHGDTTCPKCSHQWYKGFDEKLYNQITQQIELGTRSTDSIRAQIKEFESEIEKTSAYLASSREYRNIAQNIPDLQPLWDYIMEEDLIFDNPRQIVTVLEEIKEDLALHVKIGELKDRQKQAINLKLSLSKDQQVSQSKLQVKHQELEEKLYQSNLKLRESRRKCHDVQERIVTLERIEALKIVLTNQLEARNKSKSVLHDLHRREVLNACINETRKELTKREQVLSSVNIQKALVADINNQISEQTEKVEILNLIQKELSPKEGLIARGLSGFINHFVGQMNTFIKKIWLYPLEIVPIAPDPDEDVDLDFKFEVRINDDNTIPDIKKASSGMKEVIDLAFSFVSMVAMGMADFPIYLDEFGKAMDAAHRQNAFHFITNLLTTSNFSQIFMISHYEDSYGGLANTDVTVLCDENVQLTKGSYFNKHVVLN